uniref:Rubber elongation factor-like protein n=1 Tax=Hevea brasiliensis TaxID=3981 RepID=A0A1W6LRW6_HEVBR|nr:rubber elongation factor-like protein [Hevea brasiliensis]
MVDKTATGVKDIHKDVVSAVSKASSIVGEAAKGVENIQQGVASAVSEASNTVEEAAKGAENIQQGVLSAVSEASSIVEEAAKGAENIQQGALSAVSEASSIVENILQQAVVSVGQKVAQQTTKLIGNEEEERLKYLEFVQDATIYAVGSFSKLYLYAKDKSGPLKPGVNTVEVTVKSVVRPIYSKFHDVPNKALKFADHTVDASVTILDPYVPTVVKHVSIQARLIARILALSVRLYGVMSSASKLGKPLLPIATITNVFGD